MSTFVVSRPDAIGDVVLTLPVCAWLKERFPDCRVVFIGRSYTQAVVAACPHVDSFISLDELKQLPDAEQVAQLRYLRADAFLHVFPNRHLARLARAAGIPVRIGTRSRWFHWLTCNRLIALSRRNSPLHEAQLNLQLLRPLGLRDTPALPALATAALLTPAEPLAEAFQPLLLRRHPRQLNIILHPRSRGSAREWGLDHFGQLARLLHAQGHRVFITGTTAEADTMRDWLHEHAAVVTDLTGQLALPQFLAFIAAADGLIAASTGPLHLAAALGRYALGLYPPMRPIHPGRWAPLGPKAAFLVLDKPDCGICRRGNVACACIRALLPAQVLAQVADWQPLAAPLFQG